MRNVDENTITEVVLQSLESCENPRLKQILQALVTHLHDFARETRLTEAEWAKGIEFLTRTGQMCSDKRQEFILLSDTLGLSTLVTALHSPASPQATESTVFGPFHVAGAPKFEPGADISGDAPGDPLFVDAVVQGVDGSPVANADVDVWQSDEDGFYDVQYAPSKCRGRGVLRTDAQGRLRFRSVLPAAYPIPTDGPVGCMLVESGRHPWRPAHIHFMVQAAGYRRLVTQVFRSDDAYLDSDVVFGVRGSLVGQYEAHAPGVAPDGSRMASRFYTLRYAFVLEPQH